MATKVILPGLKSTLALPHDSALVGMPVVAQKWTGFEGMAGAAWGMPACTSG